MMLAKVNKETNDKLRMFEEKHLDNINDIQHDYSLPRLSLVSDGGREKIYQPLSNYQPQHAQSK